jgi:phenylacetate-CoA ligase
MTMAKNHYDAFEIRDPAVRECELFARLPGVLAHAMTAPGWAKHLHRIDATSVNSRAALAKLPVMRKSDVAALQQEHPPFGGLNVIAPGKARRLLMSPGPIFEPEGASTDGWGATRACFAAGFRAGDIVHNSFAYHLTPGGFILESGLMALSCAVIPGGVGNTDQQIAAIAHYKPAGYVGTPDYLLTLLETAEKTGKDITSIKRGLVSGAALPAPLRDELSKRDVEVLQCYATAELGVIAYESPAREGMIVNEMLVAEIVRPGTGDPVAAGEVGEVVVTSFNPDYPMIRLATGDLSAELPGLSPRGRTNMRLKGWMGRADQTAKVKGMFVHPKQIAEVGRRHPELLRLRLVIGREGEQDIMTLLAEGSTRQVSQQVSQQAALESAIAASLRAITGLFGVVKLVAPGELPNDGKVIADERKP